MNKRMIAAVLLLCLAASAAARAEQSITGFVRTPATHPAVARSLYNLSAKLNGVTGYVVALEASNTERSFDLMAVAGATGHEDLDAWFYRDIGGTGDPCPRLIDAESDGGERGTVCAGATFAVVVLFAGGDATFELAIT